jgi:hypothetical protein
MLKIDNKIKPPMKLRNERQETILALKPGESFFLPETSINSVSALTWWVRAHHPARKFTSRSIDGGVRVWRLK